MTAKKSSTIAATLAAVDEYEVRVRMLDVFASHAITGIVAGGRIGPAADMAAAAYDMAEAMVAERTRRGAK